MLASPDDDSIAQRRRYLRQLGLAGLIVLLAVTTSSAYLRLRAAGFGCPDWPVCYGQSASIAEPRGQSFRAARIVHRLAAALAGAAILGAVLIAFTDRRAFRRELVITAALAALALFLALLGRATPGSALAAIAMGNLVGGMSMAALFALLAFGRPKPAGAAVPLAALWTARAAILLTMALLALGSFTSATFSGLACVTFPSCNGQWWPASASLDDFKAWRTMGGETPVGGASVHMAHRYLAFTVAGLCLVLAGLLRKLQGASRHLGLLIAGVVLVQVAVGVTMVILSLPFALALAHNVGAALLLVTLVAAHESLKPGAKLI